MTYDFSNPSYVRHGLYLNSLLNADLSVQQNIEYIKRYEQQGLERKSGIYVVFNIKTGDYYVGSSQDTRTRKSSHYYSMSGGKKGGNILLRKHAIKYGVESFMFLFIHEVPKENLSEAELFWINYLNPFYNIHTTISRRPVMSDAGKKVVGHRSKHIRDNNVYKVPVLQYSLTGEFIKEWPSVKEATIGIGASGGHISIGCRTGRVIYGYKWEYKNGMTKSKPRYKKQ